MIRTVIFIFIATLFIIGLQFYGKPVLGLSENTWSVIIGLLSLLFGVTPIIKGASLSKTLSGDNNISIQNTGNINGNITIHKNKDEFNDEK
ncbi:hypothetical protein [Bibersteinia trehalosi]|uniref:hypothetical protein n=1 Tax=Bibersteinia trehalosi TaxID=47735 RepID=UPI00046CB93B|nr:hypothetical protein [Bibersteinia trehalosi]